MKTKIIIILILFILGMGAWLLVQKNTNTSQSVISQPTRTVESLETSQPLPLKSETEIDTIKTRTPSKYVCVGEYCDGSGESDDYLKKNTVLQIPLTTDGGNLGCGAKLFFAPHAIPKTTTVLDATYRLLFDLKSNSEIPTDGFRNAVGAYTQLFYDSVILHNGVAKLYLSGTMYGPGHCAEPELRAQIDQAALQFPTVQKLEVYLNGKIFDWCTMDLSDGEGPCPEKPQLWVTEK